MHAKLQVTKVTKQSESFVQLELAAVTTTIYGPNGENDDNTFARWTPTANLSMSITNPALVDKFIVGQKFYLDFTRA